ncbi:hypothetical protein [Micromonospora sp. NPDC049282]|uniref:hypothetical protein n=1 Tax=Micromonospora sp. NPDC049282 TaxID=3364269 RepID=UPI003716AC10
MSTDPVPGPVEEVPEGTDYQPPRLRRLGTLSELAEGRSPASRTPTGRPAATDQDDPRGFIPAV